VFTPVLPGFRPIGINRFRWSGGRSGPTFGFGSQLGSKTSGYDAGSIYDSDPGVQAARAQEEAGLSELDAILKKNREAALVAFGDEDMQDISPELRELIRKNYASGNAILARLRHQRDLGRTAILNRLAGRGLLRSGDLGYLEGENARQAGNAEYDARNKLLAALQGYLQDYVDRKQQLHNQTLGAYQNAYYQMMSNPDQYLGIYGGGGSRVPPGGSAAIAALRRRRLWG
jgi:hypothetical protein